MCLDGLFVTHSILFQFSSNLGVYVRRYVATYLFILFYFCYLLLACLLFNLPLPLPRPLLSPSWSSVWNLNLNCLIGVSLCFVSLLTRLLAFYFLLFQYSCLILFFTVHLFVGLLVCWFLMFAIKRGCGSYFTLDSTLLRPICTWHWVG